MRQKWDDIYGHGIILVPHVVVSHTSKASLLHWFSLWVTWNSDGIWFLVGDCVQFFQLKLIALAKKLPLAETVNVPTICLFFFLSLTWTDVASSNSNVVLPTLTYQSEIWSNSRKSQQLTNLFSFFWKVYFSSVTSLEAFVTLDAVTNRLINFVQDILSHCLLKLRRMQSWVLTIS